MKRNIVIETGEIVKTSGRSAKVISLNKNAGRILSLELLTNSIYGVISNLYGDILFEVTNPIENPETLSTVTDLAGTVTFSRPPVTLAEIGCGSTSSGLS